MLALDLRFVPVFYEWNGDGSLVSFEVSLNMHRMHLDGTQKAIIAHEMLLFILSLLGHRTNVFMRTTCVYFSNSFW